MLPTTRQSILTFIGVAALSLLALLPGTSVKAQAFYDAYTFAAVQNLTTQNDSLSVDTFSSGEASGYYTYQFGLALTNGYPVSTDGSLNGAVTEAFGLSLPVGTAASENVAYFTGLTFTNTGDTDISISTQYELYAYAEAFATSNLYNYNDRAYANSYAALYQWDGLNDPSLLSYVGAYARAAQGDFIYDYDLFTTYDFTLAAHSTQYLGIVSDTYGYAVSIPEPGSVALLITGSLFGLGIVTRRRVRS